MTTPSSTASLLVARGFALFPLRAGSKQPAVARDWEHAATTSLVRLRQLSADPRANYGVACGPSNLIVIDLDVAKDADARTVDGAAEDATTGAPCVTPVHGAGVAHGMQVLRELAAGRELPRTFTVRTPSGGTHLYFRPPVDGPAPRNTVRRLGPLIDTRGVGGYVVAPGSRVDGAVYEIVDDAPIAELPEWIAGLLRPLESRPVAGEPLPLSTALGPVGARLGGAYARTALEREAARVESARVGTRNDTLNRAAYSLGTLVGSGMLDRARVEAELTRAALAAGLDERETASTVRSGLTAGMARPRRLIGVGASAAAAGVHQPALDEGLAEAASYDRPLIPRDTRRSGDWPDAWSDAWPDAWSDTNDAERRVFVDCEELGEAAYALRRELAASPPRPAATPEAPARVSPTALVALLDELDEAYDRTAQAAGALAGSGTASRRWRGIQALCDLLRDLRDELEAVVERADVDDASVIGASSEGGGASSSADAVIPPAAAAQLRTLISASARRIVTLAAEISGTLGSEGLRGSPLARALRRTRRAAEALAGTNSPLTPTGFAQGRGALQAQLDAMRRDLRTTNESSVSRGSLGHGAPREASGGNDSREVESAADRHAA